MTDDDIAAKLLAVHAGAAPTRIVIEDEQQAYAVQALVAAKLGGPIGGWKVGSPCPDSQPNCAPMPAATIYQGPKQLDAARFTQREVESEIGFFFRTDLPPRDTPYSQADIRAAIGTCQPGIELLQSRLENPDTVGPLAILADFIQTGAYIWGEPIADWQALDFTTMHITQTITGGPTTERIGNPAGDMIRLMVWLANTGATWAGGIRAGQIVTCGSWTGKTKTPASAEITAAFSGAQPVRLRIG